MRFLIDRCAGARLARWLRSAGHDVVDAGDSAADPGDPELLAAAAADGRILVTIDKDFGKLVFVTATRHRGLIRLPDRPGPERITMVKDLLDRHRKDLEAGAVITVRISGRIRVWHPNVE
jgi:predicted nuclease of predicted toxin-antitoxin system